MPGDGNRLMRACAVQHINVVRQPDSLSRIVRNENDGASGKVGFHQILHIAPRDGVERIYHLLQSTPIAQLIAIGAYLCRRVRDIGQPVRQSGEIKPRASDNDRAIRRLQC